MKKLRLSFHDKLKPFKSKVFFVILAVLSLLSSTCLERKKDRRTIVVGAEQSESYLPRLAGKRVAVVANQTSVIPSYSKSSHRTVKYTHIVDSLLSLKVNIVRVFSPEHGFRGKADAGKAIKDRIDTKTGLHILSLYGKNKKPSIDSLGDIDLIIFDLQDVGARFYTYLSTLHYIMESCAENSVPLLVLDRPNPNGYYIDGPVLEEPTKSFVGMHPVPIVYGMTIGEYAQMINGEGWLNNGLKCDLSIIPLRNYDHQVRYSLPIKPSPNLPNDLAINLYPSLCLFEGTNVSVGRGTAWQFQIIGSPLYADYPFQFTPKSNSGARYPKFENQICYGKDLRKNNHLSEVRLDWLIEFYNSHKRLNTEIPYFNSYFEKLTGNHRLRKQIEQGMSEEEIKMTWCEDIEKFKKTRKKYLIYD